MDDPLQLENRKRIFECVRNSPGLHFREIQRRIELPIGVLDYHLNYLVQKGIIVVRKQEGFSRYYPGGHITTEKMRLLSCLRQEIPRGVILYLLRNPGATHGQILARFSISGGTLSYHIKKMLALGAITVEKKGRESHFSVADPGAVTDLLIVYRRTFLDKLVDDFVAVHFMGVEREGARAVPSRVDSSEAKNSDGGPL